jgi:hypothetical protein
MNGPNYLFVFLKKKLSKLENPKTTFTHYICVLFGSKLIAIYKQHK